MIWSEVKDIEIGMDVSVEGDVRAIGIVIEKDEEAQTLTVAGASGAKTVTFASEAPAPVEKAEE